MFKWQSHPFKLPHKTVVNTIKYLGIIMDYNMKFTSHIIFVVRH